MELGPSSTLSISLVPRQRSFVTIKDSTYSSVRVSRQKSTSLSAENTKAPPLAFMASMKGRRFSEGGKSTVVSGVWKLLQRRQHGSRRTETRLTPLAKYVQVFNGRKAIAQVLEEGFAGVHCRVEERIIHRKKFHPTTKEGKV